MPNIKKTNAARILDQMKISYELIEYTVDENNLGAAHIAEQLGQPIEQLFKTLVLRGDRNGLFVCVIPSAEEVDLKKAAKATGNKKCDLIPMKELLPTTGYIRGGCSPIGMKKFFTTVIHRSAEEKERIMFSGGKIGFQIEMALSELKKAIPFSLADITV